MIDENPIFICGHRKSGTTLLINLFDGHPELCVIPTDTGFWYQYYPLCEKESWKDFRKMNVISEYCIEPFKNSFDRCQSKPYLDMKLFHERFELTCKTFDELTTKNMLLALMQTYNYMSPFEMIYQKYWMEKTTSSEIYHRDILKMWPNAKFIHVVRDPRDNYASLKSGWEKRYKHYNKNKQELMQSMIDRCLPGMKIAYLMDTGYNIENYYVIKYEDLVCYTEKTMNELCDFLEIEWNDCLLEPTMWDHKWKGNNFDNDWNGISDKSIQRYENELTEDEKALIEFYFDEIMEHFEYDLEYNYKWQKTIEAFDNYYKWYKYKDRK